MSDKWLSITYLLYCTMFYGLTFGLIGYAVFFRGYSGWWMLAAVHLSACGYKPWRWRQLLTGEKTDSKGTPLP